MATCFFLLILETFQPLSPFSHASTLQPSLHIEEPLVAFVVGVLKVGQCASATS
jgi:hypothetical protein